MHDVGAIIWIVLVGIGVISSISKRARASQRGTTPRPAPVPRPIPPAVPSRIIRTYARPAPAPPAIASPPTIASPPAIASPPVTSVMPEPQAEPAGVMEAAEPIPAPSWPGRAGVLRGLFEDRRSLVRAVIAAEVLGPPAALREQRLWSPRHSDPST